MGTSKSNTKTGSKKKKDEVNNNSNFTHKQLTTTSRKYLSNGVEVNKFVEIGEGSGGRVFLCVLDGVEWVYKKFHWWGREGNQSVGGHSIAPTCSSFT